MLTAQVAKIVTLHWSTGIHKDCRDLGITKFVLRPKFMWYEFEVRTQDNVEIVIGITFELCKEWFHPQILDHNPHLLIRWAGFLEATGRVQYLGQDINVRQGVQEETRSA
jgi:hypothetical protein